MKVLVIGQGGREHALVHALSLSASVTEVHALPGNDGIARNALCHNVDWRDFEAIHNLCLKTEIDLVMIGPEDPLVAGLADFLRDHGVLAVGPNREAAKLEGSKIFAKEFMRSAKIPTANFEIVNSVEQTLSHAKKYQAPYVLKADGLAAGKGVFICKTLPELESAARFLFEEQGLGTAGARALLEEFTPGWELSWLVVTNGTEFQNFPLAQDHKRLKDFDEGPNTGGMGTVAPLMVSSELRAQVEEQIIQPTLKEIQKRSFIYRGIIFFGLMISPNGPSLLEYNCRFGDPETQSILPLLDVDLGELLKELATGKMIPVKVKNLHSACVVMAAPGYPQAPEKNVLIRGDVESESSSSYFLHAGTKKNSLGQWTTNGGRVLNAVAIGSSLQEAKDRAYQQVSKVHWAGMQVRKDIGGSKNST